MKEYNVLFAWDEEARVWIATSEDVQGLVLESGSLDALMERVKIAIPELLSLNHTHSNQFTIHYNASKHDLVSVYG